MVVPQLSANTRKRCIVVWNKLFAGGLGRKSRLHDHLGHRVTVNRIVRNGTRAVISGIRRVVFKSLPSQPWISYDGQAILSKHLNAKSRVLEFGSGTSTAWYADRCGFLLSHEDSSEWFDLIGKKLGNRQNVFRKLCLSFEDYVCVSDEHRSSPFDLIMVDGRYRDECVAAAFQLLSRTGILYLDNSDKSAGPESGNVPLAKSRILDFAKSNGKRVITLTDFAPSQFFVSEATILFND